jgi:uncharacterized protein
LKPLQNLAVIEQSAFAKENENDLFKQFLRSQHSSKIDEMVQELNTKISPQIDCTQCGNCCRSLMINVAKNDAERLARHLNISPENFYKKYIETSSHGNLSVMNKIPCHFLHENKCTVYETRPNECREFPGLHHPNFTQRLFATFMHYARCPIIYNVVENLKQELNFKIH